MEPKTFERWCEDNGRRWIGCRNYAEYWGNVIAYEAYRDRFERWARRYQASKPNQPTIDGGDDGAYCGPDCGFLLGLGDCRIDGGDNGAS